MNIVEILLENYSDRERVTFTGNYLRMFTDSSVLISGWLSMDNIKKLFKTILDDDFNVQSDAIMTVQVSCDLTLQNQSNDYFSNYSATSERTIP